MGYEESGNKESVFNAGVAQAERIDSLQRAINMARFNLKLVNPMTNTFNYDIIISSLDGLMEEVWSKCKPAEQKDLQTTKILIQNFLKINPVVRIDKNTDLIWNENNLFELKRLIEIFEKLVRDCLDAHKFNSPSRDEDDEGW